MNLEQYRQEILNYSVASIIDALQSNYKYIDFSWGIITDMCTLSELERDIGHVNRDLKFKFYINEPNDHDSFHTSPAITNTIISEISEVMSNKHAVFFLHSMDVEVEKDYVYNRLQCYINIKHSIIRYIDIDKIINRLYGSAAKYNYYGS